MDLFRLLNWHHKKSQLNISFQNEHLFINLTKVEIFMPISKATTKKSAPSDQLKLIDRGMDSGHPEEFNIFFSMCVPILFFFSFDHLCFRMRFLHPSPKNYTDLRKSPRDITKWIQSRRRRRTSSLFFQRNLYLIQII